MESGGLTIDSGRDDGKGSNVSPTNKPKPNKDRYGSTYGDDRYDNDPNAPVVDSSTIIHNVDPIDEYKIMKKEAWEEKKEQAEEERYNQNKYHGDSQYESEINPPAGEYIGTYLSPVKRKGYDNGLYNSPEEVAYAFGMDYNDDSINEDREYGANITAVDVDGETMYTYDKVYKGTPKKGRIAKMALSDAFNRAFLALSPVKAEEIPVGNVHTHAQYNGDSDNFFSKQDDRYLLGATYMVSPDGSLHYLQGEVTNHSNQNVKQSYIDNKKMNYGEVVRWGLPYDPNTKPYEP